MSRDSHDLRDKVVLITGGTGGIVDRFWRLGVALANAGILARIGTLRTTPVSSVESLR